MIKTQTRGEGGGVLWGNKGEEREKKDICECQNKGVDKDQIEFLRKAELLMMSHCRKEFIHTHTSRFPFCTWKNTTT